MSQTSICVRFDGNDLNANHTHNGGPRSASHRPPSGPGGGLTPQPHEEASVLECGRYGSQDPLASERVMQGIMAQLTTESLGPETP